MKTYTTPTGSIISEEDYNFLPDSFRAQCKEMTYKEEPEIRTPTKQDILNTIKDLCSGFIYYDRKEDEELSPEQLQQAIASGIITIDEMVNEFRENLISSFSK